MIKDNGKHPSDPDYDDYGFSDFISDYAPDEDQISEWFSNNGDSIVVALEAYPEVQKVLDDLWKDEHQDEIEEEWNARGDDQ